jgi:hypothetical protein
MAAPHDGPLGQPRSLPPAAGGSINGMRVLMGIILLVIGIAAISGVLLALSAGQPTVAIIIGLLAAAFFTRVGC